MNHFLFIILLFSFSFSGATIGEKYVINLSISENKGGGEEIINLKSYIREKKLKIKISGSFDIISNEPDIGNYFLLDSKSGQLKLRSNIDREAICKHIDLCRITMLISVNEKILEVVIEILDQNDNNPQFALRYKTLTIQENINIGLEMSLPTAEDADSMKYGIFKYYIEDSPTSTTIRGNRYKATKYFRILEKTINNVKIPYLKTIKDIDREEVDQFELILVAEDSGKQRGSCTVTVNVADVNDNSPQWPSSSLLKKIRECDRQGPLLELQAFDRDDSSTGNGQIKYKISDHSPKIEIINRIFYIAGSNLFLSSHTLQTPEIGNKIDFFITAIDGGGRENDTAVTIEIEDCNDHAPNIQLSKRSTTIMENDKKNKFLTSVTVKDDDREGNSEFNCELNDTSFLTLQKQHSFHQPNGGLLVMYQLEKIANVMFDREKVSYYSVMIRCIDQGRPSLTGEKIFSISILDQNDNPPIFPNKEFRFSLTENNLVGALVGYVKAYDADSIENGRISYQILNNDDNIYFTITNNGKIEAKLKFDRETKSSYSFTMLARDNGDPALNDTCIVKITILDVNDCLPTFKQQYYYQITESNGHTTIHAILGKIVAEDQDLGENGTVYYQIKQSVTNYNKYSVNTRPMIKISSEGSLSIYGVIDREKVSSIQADVIAFDTGRPPLSSVITIIVDVLDLNDNKPKFKSPMTKVNYINVSADTAIGSILVSVEAEDPDKGENGTITYSIMGSNSLQENSPFQLQQDGRLILIRNLKERDVTVRLPDRIMIKAIDGGDPPLFDTLTLHIKYIMNDPKTKDNIIQANDRKYDKNRINTGNIDGFRENESADNMILLYVLAGVLFTVFLIVLLVLMYTYFSGRFIRRRNTDHSHEKQLNNLYNDRPGSYECELLTAGSPSDGRDEFHKVSTISMTFPTVEKGNYTHLTMNDSNYTPIQITPNYFQNMSTCPTMSQQPNILQSNPPFNYELCHTDRIGVSVKNPNRLSNRWNSIENISQTNDVTLNSTKGNQDNSFFYNAHSYAAYINQYGKDDTAPNVWIEDITNKTKVKQQTLPISSTKLPQDDQTISNYQPLNSTKNQIKKCYVTSSFV